MIRETFDLIAVDEVAIGREKGQYSELSHVHTCNGPNFAADTQQWRCHRELGVVATRAGHRTH